MAEQNNDYTPKSLTLKAMPEDVYKALLGAQASIKQKKVCQVSLETVVYKMVRAYGKNLPDEEAQDCP